MTERDQYGLGVVIWRGIMLNGKIEPQVYHRYSVTGDHYWMTMHGYTGMLMFSNRKVKVSLKSIGQHFP
ncbi:hypothetical protein TNCV_1918671 [Trichonephila clavipes]|nr:hypothetical protein TNCV_1918671 [Trichonephila clavipes]